MSKPISKNKLRAQIRELKKQLQDENNIRAETEKVLREEVNKRTAAEESKNRAIQLSNRFGVVSLSDVPHISPHIRRLVFDFDSTVLNKCGSFYERVEWERAVLSQVARAIRCETFKIWYEKHLGVEEQQGYTKAFNFVEGMSALKDSGRHTAFHIYTRSGKIGIVGCDFRGARFENWFENTPDFFNALSRIYETMSDL